MSYQLTLEPLGATIEVEDGQTLLDAALRRAYTFRTPAAGLCGTCKATVLVARWTTARPIRLR